MGAHMFETVASHAISRPREYGSTVAPFGRFPSATSRPIGSSVEASPQEARAFQNRKFISVASMTTGVARVGKRVIAVGVKKSAGDTGGRSGNVGAQAETYGARESRV